VNRARLNNREGGSLSVSVTREGIVTGSVVLNGRVRSLRGSVGDDGKIFAVTDAMSGQASYRLNLTARQAGQPSARLTGSISSGTQQATVQALVSPWGSGRRSTPYAGTYKLRFNAAGKAADAPAAPRQATMQVRPNGVVNITGRMGRGAPFSWSGRLSGDGKVRLQANVTKHGSVLGTIELKKNKKAYRPAGTLSWERPKQGKRAGFRLSLAVRPQ